MLYSRDELLVKTEPILHSPCATTSNGLPGNTVLSNNISINVSNNGLQNNGLVTSLAGGSSLAPSNGLQTNTLSANGVSNNGSFSTIVTSGTKRPRPDDWLSSPSPGTVSAVSVPPLTPSPGPPSHTYTVISNGYSSPMSSGSYDPYSPNGKIGKFIIF